MESTYFELTPSVGWSAFADSRSLVDQVSAALDREKSGDRWCYYNFTSDTAWWLTEESGRNEAYIEFQDDLETVSKLLIGLDNDDSLSYRELRELKQRLIVKYDLEATEIPPSEK